MCVRMGLAALLFGLAVGPACAPRSGKVLIIRDGSVEVVLQNSTLDEEKPTEGKKFRWSTGARSVQVWACGQPEPEPRPFGRVTVHVTGGPGVRLHVRNEGPRLVITFGGPYDLTGAGGSRRLEHAGGADLRISRVDVDGQEAPSHERTCLRFQE